MRWIMKGIKDHALLYALIAKYCIDTYGRETGEERIRDITVMYGKQRGARMRAKTDADHEAADITAYLIHGEWKGEPGENISEMEYADDSTESHVFKCAWCDTWNEYGLMEYGRYYCRYIDQALCEGFDGNFSLHIPKMLSAGDDMCRFIWTEKADAERAAVRKAELKDTYILPFDFHCEELLGCAERVLCEAGDPDAVAKIRQEYEKTV